MCSYTINLVEMADTAEGGELQCGGVGLTSNPCGITGPSKRRWSGDATFHATSQGLVT